MAQAKRSVNDVRFCQCIVDGVRAKCVEQWQQQRRAPKNRNKVNKKKTKFFVSFQITNLYTKQPNEKTEKKKNENDTVNDGT